MLEQTRDEPFVIVEETKSKKFVQFTGSVTGGLLLDLPIQTLAREEQERAQRLFVALGGPGLEKWPVFDVPGGNPVGEQAGFQMDFGRDADRAATIAMRVFREVYLFSDEVDVTIIEN